jgi:hypothetical protein
MTEEARCDVDAARPSWPIPNGVPFVDDLVMTGDALRPFIGCSGFRGNDMLPRKPDSMSMSNCAAMTRMKLMHLNLQGTDLDIKRNTASARRGSAIPELDSIVCHELSSGIATNRLIARVCGTSQEMPG